MKRLFRVLSLNSKNNYRDIMKGYKRLSNNNKYDLIFELKKELTRLKLNIKNEQYDKFLFLKNNSLKSELIIRQFILSNFLNSYFNRSVLEYFGKNENFKFKDGYPLEWLKLLSKKEIIIDYKRSLINWKLKTAINLIASFRTYTYTIIN